MGHRRSVDLDLFTIEDFEAHALALALSNDYPLQVNHQMPQTLIGSINETKVDFIRFRYPFIRPVLHVGGVRMLSVEDIAPMKLDAVTGRGSKKDFYDLYFLLRSYSLEEMLALYLERYPHQTTFHVVRRMTYFVDAENDPDPVVFDKKVSWAKVKKAVVKAVQGL